MGTLFTALGAAAALAGTDIIPVHQGGARAVGLTGAQLLTYVGGSYVAKAGGTMTGALTLPAGSASAPSLLFTGAGATTGIFATGATGLSIASSGVAVVVFNNSTTRFRDASSSDAIILEANTAFVGLGTANDVRFGRDAAATLAQRNGTNAQTLRVYSTYTSASVYSRASLAATTTAVTLAAEELSTGSPNVDIVLTPAGSGSTIATGPLQAGSLVTGGGAASANGFTVSYYAPGIRMSSTCNLNWATTSPSSGADTGMYRNAAGVVEVNNGTAGTFRDLKLRNLLNTEYHQMTEMTAPSAPATNSVRIYAEDNGSGKTRLMALFATGSAVQLGIEP